jgi:hypothetical protein
MMKIRANEDFTENNYKTVVASFSALLKSSLLIGRAHTTGENGEWGETKQRSENQVTFNSVLGPS